MEKRLIETENVLCALMTQVSGDQLFSAFSHLGQSDCQPGRSAVAQPNGTALESVKTHRFGPVYWDKYPLKSAQDVQRWFEARASAAADAGESRHHPSSIEADPEESEGTRSGADESPENDSEETDGTVAVISVEVSQDGRSIKGRENASGGPGGDDGQEDTAPRIASEPEDGEDYESAFLW
ncbi:hypothetical protein LX36DRAFT_660063 [Colletotrichum falcatum]|nr:hypothetical protein LX36DRAFT_660063 [Colletotrichum falcatum]